MDEYAPLLLLLKEIIKTGYENLQGNFRKNKATTAFMFNESYLAH